MLLLTFSLKITNLEFWSYLQLLPLPFSGLTWWLGSSLTGSRSCLVKVIFSLIAFDMKLQKIIEYVILTSQYRIKTLLFVCRYVTRKCEPGKRRNNGRNKKVIFIIQTQSMENY